MGSREEQVVQEAIHQVAQKRRKRRENTSLRALLAFWATTTLVFLAAPWPLEGKLWAAAHGLCAQREGHLLPFGEQYLPLCARDSGLYLGALLGLGYLLVRRRWLAVGRPPRWFWTAFFAIVGLFAIDVANSVGADWFHSGVYPPHNLLRTVTGTLLGASLSVPLLWAVNLSFRGRRPDRPLLANGWDVLALFLLAAVGIAALWSRMAPLYVPLAALSFGGMLLLLVAANFLWLLAVLRGRSTLESAGEAWPLLLWASIASVAEMALLSFLRYRLGL
ncbi:MAG: DUF2085 domain-containing protein [Chloroflexia bacterium]